MVKNKKMRKSSGFDPEALKSLDKETLVALLVKMHEQYQQLSESMQAFMREKYGPKTERFVDSNQLHLFEEDSSAEPEENRQQEESLSAEPDNTKKNKHKGHGRNPRPSNLKRVPIRGKQPSADELRCSCCNVTRTLVNEVVRGSRYAYIPAAVHIEEFIASIFACSGCSNTLVVEPDIPQAVLKLGADPGLVSVIAVERFDDSLPLHRQERRFARLGVSIAKSTMCGWLSITAKTLRPIYDRMKILLLQSKVIATDDSPMKVQDRAKTKNIKIGRVWIYRGDDEHPLNLFDYTCGRGRAGPIAFLAGYIGYLLGDCFSGNQALCAETGCIHVACNAHARRYWIKAEPNNRSECKEILSMYRELFKIERDAKELAISGPQLKLMRKQESKPILDKIKARLDHYTVIALPKSSFGKAVHYCLNNWTELTNYLLDGDLRIDNNLAEQEMKRVAINRKNSLFFGSDQGGENAEVFMSLISSCRRHGVEPWAYLKDVIETLTKDPNTNLDQLLPHTWTPANEITEITHSSYPQKSLSSTHNHQEPLLLGTF
jgi:transposase